MELFSSPQENFLYLRKRKLQKKVSIFSQKKAFLIFQEKGTLKKFFIFQENPDIF